MRDRASQWFWCVLVTAGFFLPWLPAVVADDLIRDLAEGFPRTWPAAARVPPVAGLAGAACLLLGLALLVLVLPAAERAASEKRVHRLVEEARPWLKDLLGPGEGVEAVFEILPMRAMPRLGPPVGAAFSALAVWASLLILWGAGAGFPRPKGIAPLLTYGLALGALLLLASMPYLDVWHVPLFGFGALCLLGRALATVPKGGWAPWACLLYTSPSPRDRG